VGTDLGLIKKTGNTYFYGDVKLGIGRENSVEMLLEDQKTSAALEKEIRKICFPEKKKEVPKDDPKDTKKDPKKEADEK